MSIRSKFAHKVYATDPTGLFECWRSIIVPHFFFQKSPNINVCMHIWWVCNPAFVVHKMSNDLSYIPLSTIQKKVSGSSVSICHQSCVYIYAYMISPYPFICMAYMVFDLPRTNYLTLFDNLENWSSFSGQMKSSPRTCSSSSLIIFVVIIVVIMNGIERGNEKMKKSKERFFIVGYTL